MFTKGKSPDSSAAMPQASPATPQVESSRSTPSRGSTRSAPSLISNDMKVTGSILTEGEIQIDGHIEGDVRATALTIGEGGRIAGEVVAETIVVRGAVQGSIRGRNVQLASSAKVEGDITHASLSIEANAVFEGQVRHSQDPLADAKPQASTPNKPSNPAPAQTTAPAPSAATHQRS